MPDIKNLQLSLSKRVDMSKFFGPDAYVTIKRLSKKSKKIIQMFTLDVGIVKIARQMIDSGEGTQELNQEQLGLRYLELPEEDKQKSQKALDYIYEIYMDEGIDSEEHNLTNDGKKIKLCVDFWEYYEEAAVFIHEKVKEFNKEELNYGLGESLEGKSIM